MLTSRTGRGDKPRRRAGGMIGAGDPRRATATAAVPAHLVQVRCSPQGHRDGGSSISHCTAHWHSWSPRTGADPVTAIRSASRASYAAARWICVLAGTPAEVDRGGGLLRVQCARLRRRAAREAAGHGLAARLRGVARSITWPALRSRLGHGARPCRPKPERPTGGSSSFAGLCLRVAVCDPGSKASRMEPPGARATAGRGVGGQWVTTNRAIPTRALPLPRSARGSLPRVRRRVEPALAKGPAERT